MTVTLVVVDDQATVREALEVMLGLVDDLTVVATARNGEEALAAVAEFEPDVVLLDLNMPVLGGVETTRILRERHPATAVVILTTFDDDASILAALRSGALGYLTKDADRAEIVQAIRGAALGQSVLDPDVQGRLLALAGGTTANSGEPPAGADHFTSREAEVLQLIGLGLKNADIAARLSISEVTVKTHINNLFAKADLHSRSDAVRYALTHAPEGGA